MATNGESGPSSNNDNGSIRSLISSVKTDAQTLLKAQAELTQIELKRSATEAGGAGGMFGGAAAFAGMGGVFVLITIAYGLVALGLPEWAGFGIVALLLLVAAGIFALVGKGKADKVKGPELAKEEWERTKQAFSGQEPESLSTTTAAGAVEAARP